MISYHERDFVHILDQCHIVLERVIFPLKCNKICEKIIKFDYQQTTFNFVNLLTVLNFTIKISNMTTGNSIISDLKPQKKVLFNPLFQNIRILFSIKAKIRINLNNGCPKNDSLKTIFHLFYILLILSIIKKKRSSK